MRLGLSEVVNDLARRGLARPTPSPTFVQRTADVGRRIDVTDVAATLEALDGPEAR